MTKPFSEVITSALDIIEESSVAAVDHNIDELAEMLAKRLVIPKWVASSAIVIAYKRKGGNKSGV